MTATIPTYDFYEADKIKITCPATFEEGSGVTTLVGGEVSLDAVRSGVKYPGTATVTDATTVDGYFEPYTFTPGLYDGQVWAQPLGGDPCTPGQFKLRIHASAKAVPAP